MSEQVTLTVTINGTDSNPEEATGLKSNPFPQPGKEELYYGERLLASLDGEPIWSAQDIRNRLAGCTDELIGLCIQQWIPGHRVQFKIKFSIDREP